MSQVEQLSYAAALKAVAHAQRERLGAVGGFARLQLARAAAAEGRAAEALSAAVEATFGLAVATELGDPGQVLRWQGDALEAWGGISPASREAGDRRAFLEGGVDALGAVLTVACGGDGDEVAAVEGALVRAQALPHIELAARWSGVLAHLDVILAGVLERPRDPFAPPASSEPDVAIWETFQRAVDPRRSVVSRYADSLGVLVSLATGGVAYRPLRVGAGRVFLHLWRRAVEGQPFLFRQPALRRERLDELGPQVRAGDLGATAQMMKVLAEGVAVTLPWELEAWLGAPFEGVHSGAVVEE